MTSPHTNTLPPKSRSLSALAEMFAPELPAGVGRNRIAVSRVLKLAHLAEVYGGRVLDRRLLGERGIILEKPRKTRREPERIRDGRAPLEALPLFATDTQLGEALLGRERVEEWRQLAPLLEARGFPKVDQMMGGRFIHAVLDYFKQQYGLGPSKPLAPDGVEDFETCKRKK